MTRREDIYDEQERIHREVVIIEEDNDDENYYGEQDEEEGTLEDEDEGEDEPFADINAADRAEQEIENGWMLITTGRILTDGALPYYRYFIAIAIMCFFSIFLTFVSLNANREYRQREKHASVLHERSVLKEEERYGLSSKSEITSRLEGYGIKLVDLSKESRLITNDK